MSNIESSRNISSPLLDEKALPQCVSPHEGTQEASLITLEQILGDLEKAIPTGTRDTFYRAISTWALLLGQYEGSETVSFAFLPGKILDQSAGDEVSPKEDYWVLDVAFSLNWRLSDLRAHVASSRVDVRQLAESSKIRTLLQLVRGDSLKPSNRNLSASQIPFDVVAAVNVEQGGGDVEVECPANGYFAPEQAHTIIGQFQHILASVNSLEDYQLKALVMAPDQDLARILEWNNNVPLSIESCVHDVIESQGRSTPEAEAIHAWDGSMTYQELADISNIVAQNLIEYRNIGSGSVVALCFEKSKWVVVGMLAVVKTGATFLLLDPSHPEKRLRYMTEKVQAHAIICSNPQLSAGTFGETPILGIDDLTNPPGASPAGTTNQLEVTPESDLYIMFTSGTTGRPKAFAVQHKAFCSSAMARAPSIKRNASSRVLQFAAFSFDPCIEDILTTLIFGGCICIPSEFERINDLVSFIRRANVNTANVTPGVIDLLEPAEVPSLKVLILSGEAMKKHRVETWGAVLNLMNGYGPSEVCIKCALNPSVTIGTDPKNIGKAVGTVLWITDALNHKRLAPIGAVGELVVEGPTLSRGYLDDNSAQKAFIEGPSWLSNIRGVDTWVYRTGDLVRYNVDSSITFISRLDSQVKIRGQRIELQEVEQVIAELLPVGWQAVSEVVVFQGTDEPALTAFLRDKTGTQSSIASSNIILEDRTTEFSSFILNLEENMSKLLPKFMVPSAFLPIAHVPLTVHGKTDRATIQLQASKLHKPAPFTSALVAKHISHEATEIEAVLKTLWSKVLKRLSQDEIGRHTSFFTVGGDSLSAIRLVTAAKNAGWFLTASRVFEYPTLASMAAQIEPMRETDRSSEASQDIDVETKQRLAVFCDVQSDLIQDVYPCVPIQEFWMGRSLQRPGEFKAQFVYELGDNIDVQRLKSTWTQMHLKYPILRTAIIKGDDGLSQVVINAPPIWDDFESLAEFLDYDEAHNFQLGQRLSRSALINDKHTKKRYFSWTAHHCSFDGWARQLLLRELVKNYKTGQLDPNVVSFKAFVNRVHRVDRSVHESYWRQQFSGMNFKPFLHLPSSQRQRISQQVIRTIPAKRLKGSNVTISTMVYVAWSIIMSRQTGCTDVAFMTILSGRDWAFPGIEDVMGPTAALIPLLVHVEPRMAVLEILNRTQARLLEMTGHIHLGWERISNVSDEARRGCEYALVVATLPPGANIVDYEMPGFSVEREGFRNDHPFRAQCFLGDDTLQVVVTFDERVTDEVSVQQLIANLASVLDQMAQFEPEAKVEEFKV
ncbi:hypothetical protein F5B18DRAFT_635043 [Nemania serpens]|nr:hypothetical protein F5B18DRAFT_635043 [Nemania serpens]